MAIVVLALAATGLVPQTPNPHLPEESAGIDGVVQALLAAFDRADIVALGEMHGRQLDTDLRIALVRHPGFAKHVRSIVVEFGSTTEQATLDRYIRGDAVTPAQLAQVWKTTTQPQFADHDARFFVQFFDAVRAVNAKLPADARIRVFGGDPGPTDHRSRETAAFSVLKEQVLEKRGKALVIYGAAHFYRAFPADYLASMATDVGLARMLDRAYPGRTFVVIPIGGPTDPPPATVKVVTPDYRTFDRALQTRVRPVLVSLQRSPFRELSVEEFLGQGLLSCRPPDGCRSAFRDSPLTLGQMADAVVYFGDGADRR